jgi:hypothetical protein
MREYGIAVEWEEKEGVGHSFDFEVDERVEGLRDFLIKHLFDAGVSWSSWWRMYCDEEGISFLIFKTNLKMSLFLYLVSIWTDHFSLLPSQNDAKTASHGTRGLQDKISLKQKTGDGLRPLIQGRKNKRRKTYTHPWSAKV